MMAVEGNGNKNSAGLTVARQTLGRGGLHKISRPRLRCDERKMALVEKCPSVVSGAPGAQHCLVACHQWGRFGYNDLKEAAPVWSYAL